MKTTLLPIIDRVIEAEKGFTLNADDAGNWTGGKVGVGTLEGTNMGITVATARKAGYIGPMKDLPRDTAVAIYLDQYVIAPKFDQVFGIDDRVGFELVDTGVNCGQATAGKMLQRLLNVNNAGGRYADLLVDGGVGDKTLNALRSYKAWRGDEGMAVLYVALNGLQTAYYADIAERNPAQRQFFYGWVRARVYEQLKGL